MADRVSGVSGLSGRNENTAARLGRFAAWRVALAACLLPRGFAIWTYGLYGDEGYDELVIAKEIPDA